MDGIGEAANGERITQKTGDLEKKQKILDAVVLASR